LLTTIHTTTALTLLLAYTVWQLLNLWYWRRTVTFKRPKDQKTKRPETAILIPFRNEAANLPRLAASLLGQTYAGPTELIFIDDHSDDGGAELLPKGVTVLKLADYLQGAPTVAHKKAALTYAIDQTKAEIIVTTDADCDWPPDRLERIVTRFGAGADVVLGPVLIAPNDGFCRAFQALDLAAYQFLTAATAARNRPALANGANFAFRRQLFLDVGGYGGVDHLPSGDDVLLLHKIWARTRDAKKMGEDLGTPTSIVYAPDASVTTRPVEGWRALWRQRLRWAGKAGEYVNPELRFAQGLTFLLCLAIVTTLLLLPLYPRPRLLILLFGGKILVDGLCLWYVTRHFGQGRLMRWFPAAALLYPFFLVGVGTAALLGFKVGWKGRR